MTAAVAPILEVDHLSRRFGGLTAVDDVSMRLLPGELRCIIGPNGAGKSTFFNLISGAVEPTSGRVLFHGRDITGLPVHRVAKLGIGRKFQVPSVFETLTVRENLGVSGLNKWLRPRDLIQQTARRDSIDDTLARVNLEHRADIVAGALAHGEKQWLEIGMALVTDPLLLLLDEPTAGMTADETYQTAQLVRQLTAHLTIVVIEHDMQFVRDIASRITVLHRGAVLREGTLAEIEDDEVVRDVYLGRQ
jgi:urea ABC transporter ATP-binding protein UrtD